MIYIRVTKNYYNLDFNHQDILTFTNVDFILKNIFIKKKYKIFFNLYAFNL